MASHALPFCLYLFNRGGELLTYIEWSRPRAPANLQHDGKMMFGLLHSLNSLSQSLDPGANPGAPASAHAARRPATGGFHTFRTNTYKLHFLEVPSGLLLALTTEPGAGDAREALRHIHAAFYVELVAKSPLHAPGKPFSSEAFVTAVRRYLAVK